jgi:hypothetical protein
LTLFFDKSACRKTIPVADKNIVKKLLQMGQYYKTTQNTTPLVTNTPNN